MLRLVLWLVLPNLLLMHTCSSRLLSTASGGPYDVVVIGGGPGGYVGAIKAAQLGLKVRIKKISHTDKIDSRWVHN